MKAPKTHSWCRRYQACSSRAHFTQRLKRKLSLCAQRGTWSTGCFECGQTCINTMGRSSYILAHQ